MHDELAVELPLILARNVKDAQLHQSAGAIRVMGSLPD
jgi:hypothetical protein